MLLKTNKIISIFKQYVCIKDIIFLVNTVVLYFTLVITSLKTDYKFTLFHSLGYKTLNVFNVQ